MKSTIQSRGESWKVLLAIILGWSCLSFADIFTKELMQYYTPWQHLAVNSGIATTVVSLWILFKSGPTGFITPRFKIHIIRGLIICATGYCVVNALRTDLPLSDFYGITFTAPFATLILIGLFLKEPIGYHRWLGVLIGFIGVIILAGPQFNTLSTGILYALGVVLLIAVNTIVVRKLGTQDPIVLYAFYPLAIIFMTFIIPAMIDFKTPSLMHWIYFAANGLCLAAAHCLVSYAIIYARETAALSPFMYIQIIWGVIFGYFIFGDTLTTTTTIGLTLIIGAGLYNIYRERRRKVLE